MNNDLLKIEDLIHDAKYQDASDLFSKIKAAIGHSSKDYVHGLVIESSLMRANGDIDNAILLGSEALKQSIVHELPFLKIKSCVELAYALWKKGKYKEALHHCLSADRIKPSLEELSTKEYKAVEAQRRNVLGLVELDTGSLKEAMEHFNKSLQIYEKLGHKFEIGKLHNNIGAVYFNQGKIQTALDEYQLGMKEFKTARNIEFVALGYYNIGTALYELGNNLLAIESIKNAISLWKEKGTPADIAEGLFEVIHMHLSSNDTYQAEIYFSELSDVHDKHQDTPVNLVYRLAKALILKKQERLYNKFEGEKVLRELINEDINKLKWLHIIIKHYCEFLLYELKLFGTQSALEELKRILNKLSEIGKLQHSFVIVIEGLILNAKISLLEGDLNTAQLFLDQASITAEENQLVQMKLLVDHEISTLEAEFERWKDLISKNGSMEEKISQSRILQYVEDLQKLKGLNLNI